MARIVFGVFMVLHGQVHILYAAHSQRLLELQPDMRWPDGSWALSATIGTKATRVFATVGCSIGAIGFVISGAALLAGQPWWQSAAVISAAVSTATVVLCWDGRLRDLDNQGLIAVILNVVIVVLPVLLRWPPSRRP